jgi:hypothetical protein
MTNNEMLIKKLADATNALEMCLFIFNDIDQDELKCTSAFIDYTCDEFIEDIQNLIKECRNIPEINQQINNDEFEIMKELGMVKNDSSLN